MDKAIYDKLKQTLETKKIKFDKRLLIFTICLIITSVFWFLNALNKEYISDISFSVRYTDIPEDKLLVNRLPSTITLKVNAYGFVLLRYSFAKNLIPIVIDVSSLPLKRLTSERNEEYFVLTNSTKEKIEEQLEDDIKILDIEPDSLLFKFSSVTSKTLCIVPKLEVEFGKQYMLNGKIRTFPANILVKGPKVVIDTMKYVETQTLKTGIIIKTIKKSIPIKKYNNVNYSKNKVTVEIPVEKYTEASLKIPIEVINLPDNTQLQVIPQEITVNYFVCLSNYEKISPDDFTADIDFNTINNSVGNRLDVRLTKFPEFISNIRYKPKSVDYLIGKK